jgi:hypothetical protein
MKSPTLVKLATPLRSIKKPASVFKVYEISTNVYSWPLTPFGPARTFSTLNESKTSPFCDNDFKINFCITALLSKLTLSWLGTVKKNAESPNIINDIERIIIILI